MDFISSLNNRYAVKAMNGEKLPETVVNRILEAIRLAPTSSGLQPFQVLVITNQALKDKIREFSFNQSVVSDCSHLLVFAAWDTYTADRINSFFDYTNQVRGFTNEGWENYRNQLLKTYLSRDAEINFAHASKQVYLAFGIALAAAAVEGVDSTPMEGFKPNEVDEVLGLREKGLRSVALLALGYSNSEKDWLKSLKKVRKSQKDLFTHLD
jgi:nitroreductase / dihydropteridine reductase